MIIPQIGMRKPRLLGNKNRDARYNCVSLFPVSQKKTLPSHLQPPQGQGGQLPFGPLFGCVLMTNYHISGSDDSSKDMKREHC